MAVAYDMASLRGVRERVQSFEAHQERRRIRLSTIETKPIRYVLSEWDGDCGGGGSNWQTMLDNDQRVLVPRLATSLQAMERYCDKPRRERERVLQSWRALTYLARRNTISAVVIVALYGDVQPDVLKETENPWDAHVEEEYSRVCKFTLAAGGSTSALEARLRIVAAKVEGEEQDERRARLAVVRAKRKEALREVGLECEQLIVRATLDYRNAWERVAE